MRALDLDFRRSAQRAHWAGVLCLALSVAGAAIVGGQYLELTGELTDVQSGLRAPGPATRRAAAAPQAGAEVQKVSLEVKHASDILHQLNVPWDELLASVEAASIADVALLSIDSDIDRRRINIAGEAKNLPAILQYARSLQARATLSDIFLESHEFQRQDPQQPVRFLLSANWQVRK